MKYDLDDFDFKEQAEVMNILNNYNINNQIKSNQSIGFNEDSIYNCIKLKHDK